MCDHLRQLRKLAIGVFLAIVAQPFASAQLFADDAAPPRPVPPLGIEVPAADRAELERGLTALDASLKELSASNVEHIQSLLPDVQVFQRAVSSAVLNNEFFDSADIAKAKELLQVGRMRAEQLLKGDSPWAKTTGLVVRGYTSKIDSSIQPYGLVVPPSYQTDGSHKFRLDVWLHGRNEKLSEVNFLDERSKKPGEFTPPDTIVLHPYGRYCNAFKFAGEVDVLEAIEAVQRQYRIDDDRIAVRGFSMGGAGCWHLAVHYTDRWAAAAPGAGFAESEQFLKMSDNEVAALPEWQRKLFSLYDCPLYAANLYHCPTIAYNGEDDPQKQAADVMDKALQDEGIALRRIVGPHTKHSYERDAKRTIDEAVSSIIDVGRERTPTEVHLVTYTLRYNHMDWVQIDGLAEHWAESRVNAAISSTDDQSVVTADTTNVTDLTLSFPPGWCPFDVAKPVQVSVDNEELDAPRAFSDRSWQCKLHQDDQHQWKIGARELGKNELRKRPGLQGPIDDAFMDSFIIVRPTGKSARGDIAASNLILWGDEESNAVIKRINEKLPIRWDSENVVVGQEKYPAADRVPVLIYPNPLNPQRYVVFNSGFTFREADYMNNARQIPRLPDWAIIDIRTPPDATQPGKIEAAGFFGEAWELNPTAPKPNKNKTASSTSQTNST
jgi:pimeloyl-ACP methyl ester carboxylesterase